MRPLFGTKGIGTEVVITCMENDVFPFWVHEEIAVASADGAIAHIDFVIR